MKVIERKEKRLKTAHRERENAHDTKRAVTVPLLKAGDPTG